jgi:hypothetical protein
MDALVIVVIDTAHLYNFPLFIPIGTGKKCQQQS